MAKYSIEQNYEIEFFAKPDSAADGYEIEVLNIITNDSCFHFSDVSLLNEGICEDFNDYISHLHKDSYKGLHTCRVEKVYGEDGHGYEATSFTFITSDFF